MARSRLCPLHQGGGSKFIEVACEKDVESIIRELTDLTINMVKEGKGKSDMKPTI
jgi:ATP-dependent protease HslVU (ClpYQ) ATPase subunit